MQKIALGVALALAAGAATADVTYRWETIDPKLTTAAIVGKIVVADAVWRAGSVNFENSPCLGPGTCPDPENPGNPNSPVRSLAFYMQELIGKGVNLDYVNTDGDNGDGQRSGVLASVGSALGQISTAWGGQIFNAGSESYFDMNVDADGVWTVGRATSQDWGEDVEIDGENQRCWQGRMCGGETGRWVLDRSTIPVPEPSTLALAAVALAGLRAQRRLRNSG